MINRLGGGGGGQGLNSIYTHRILDIQGKNVFCKKVTYIYETFDKNPSTLDNYFLFLLFTKIVAFWFGVYISGPQAVVKISGGAC